MLIAILIAAMGCVGDRVSVTDDVDIIEFNRIYSDNGVLSFEQVIFWEWHEPTNRMQVVAWRLRKGAWQYSRKPDGSYRLAFLDTNTPRVIRSVEIRHTHTHHDPEVLEREMMPRELRTGLSKPLPAQRYP